MPGPVPPAKPKRVRAAAPETARAFGRSRADFGELLPAESALLECCREGRSARISEAVPDEEQNANRVRADFVRFLALGGDEDTPIHERGVSLEGAWLTGLLDLSSAKIEYPLSLWSCRIEEIRATQAHFAVLNLIGCRLERGLLGDRISCDGGVYFRDGFHTSGEVRLLGATIGGNLECQRSRFDNGKDDALSCDGARISGDLFFRGAHISGKVRLHGVVVGGDVDCEGAKFENPGEHALSCDGALVSGSVFLRSGCRVSGMARLLGMTVGGDLDCRGAHFENPGSLAITCDSAQVKRRFLFRSIETLKGGVDLSSLKVTDLSDDVDSWPASSGLLVLDGFTYNRLTGGASTDAATRIAWLEKQMPDFLGKDFRPQPWEQLIQVLRIMGHPGDARALAIAKQERLRRAGKIVRGARALHWLYGLLVGYGYRPIRLLAATASVWLICFLAYWAATNPAWFGAETHLLAAQPAKPGEPVPAPDYRNFVPLIYSADVLLPVVDLGYKDEWQPVVADRAGNPLIWGQLLRFLYWFEIAFGWVAGLLLVGVLGNLIKKD